MVSSDEMINVMAYIRAIHDIAKLYHWESNSEEFYADHLLFDRVAETFNEDTVDKIAENYFMTNTFTVRITYLSKLNQSTFEKVESYQLLNLDGRDSKAMSTSLFNIITDLYNYVNELTPESRSINNILDEISLNCTSLLGLLNARLSISF